MATAWGGADPVEQSDPNDYELGCEYLTDADITITHIRVWVGAGEVDVPSRRGRIWTTGGAQLGIATLPADLPVGWSQYALDTPVERSSGQRWVVTYSTGGVGYGALVNALDSAVLSGDGHVTAVRFADGAAVGGNGLFNGTVGLFPSVASGAHAFYGADCVYVLGIGGNTPPRITAATVTAAGAFATATVVAEDDETLAGATYRFDWGDGSTVAVSAVGSATHTYTTSGTYGVLLSVTDSDGLADYAAVGVDIAVPDTALTPLDAVGIINAVASHALASGRFDTVSTHEPKSAPAAPRNGLYAAVWAQGVEPAIGQSGLNLTSIRLTLNIRIYQSMLSEPQDAIDPNVLAAVDALMAAYTGDFQLGGTVRNVDLLGMAGQPLRADAGYIHQDQKIFRVMTILLPLICDNVWEQSP